MIWSDPAIISAIVVATAGIVLAAEKFLFGMLKSKTAARRQYEYDARKRLYNEFEPLSFQLVELSEIAERRIRALAWEASEGYLELNGGWYSSLSHDHMNNVIYRLLAPLATFRIMQQRLTAVDLTLDKSIKYRYLLAKVLYTSFTHDRRLAKSEPPCPEYKPKYEPWPRSEGSMSVISEVSYPQGIYHQSTIDIMLDGMLKRDTKNELRVMTFYEFKRKWCSEGQIHKRFNPIRQLLLNFHPKRKQILWRILIAQVHIHRAIKEIHENGLQPHFGKRPKALRDFPTDELEKYDWRKSTSEANDEDVFQQPFEAAENYLYENWKDFR